MKQPELTISDPGAKLVIVERSRIICCALDNHQRWSLGREDPTQELDCPDLALKSRLVSRNHGFFRRMGSDWVFVENPKNLNGTFYNGRKLRKLRKGLKKTIVLHPGDILRIDNNTLDHSDGVAILFTTDILGESWDIFSLEEQQNVVIGQNEDCSLIQPYNSLSGRHAKITPLNGEYYLSDCGSKTGTFRNGTPVTGTVILREKDHIRLGDRNYFFVRGNLLYCT